MQDLIFNLLRIAFFLAAIGQIKPVTLYLMREAAKEQQRGLISLSALNRALWSQPHSKNQKKNRPRPSTGAKSVAGARANPTGTPANQH